jgi:transcription termination factor Rho
MDQVIFEEFKGTGNNEIVLDRSIAEARIFPAINILASGTRKEERLYDRAESQKLFNLRRMLANLRPKEAMETLLKLINQYPTNNELIMNIPNV